MEQGNRSNRGINSLANTLSQAMKDHIDSAAQVALDFGIVNGDFSLTTNRFRQPIPVSDWSVLRHLTLNPEVYFSETGFKDEKLVKHKHEGAAALCECKECVAAREKKAAAGAGEGTGDDEGGDDDSKTEKIDGCEVKMPKSGYHKHRTILPPKLHRVKPGDKVLVAWVGDREAIVIGILMPAEELMKSGEDEEDSDDDSDDDKSGGDE